MTQRFVSSAGVSTAHGDTVLSVWYPTPALFDDSAQAEQHAASGVATAGLDALVGADELRGTVLALARIITGTAPEADTLTG